MRRGKWIWLFRCHFEFYPHAKTYYINNFWVVIDYLQEVATTLTNLALVYDTVGEVQKALAMYEEALDIFRRKLGPDHHYTLSTQKLIMGVKADLS